MTATRRIAATLAVDVIGQALSRQLGTCDLLGGSIAARRMKKSTTARGYRFPPAIIQQAVRLYFQSPLSFRDVEDLLAERGIGLLRNGSALGSDHFRADDRGGFAANDAKRTPRLGIVTRFISDLRPHGVSVARR